MHRIVPAHTPPHLDHARALIAEYGQAIAPIAACSLEHQGYANELASLPGLYVPPRGRLLLATLNDEPVGVVALRPLPTLGDHVCEMKRMYVRPSARAHGIGRALALRLFDEARAAGYTLMKLDSDTNPYFHAAIALYRSLGFTDCERYNADPDPRTIWMERTL